MPRNKYMKCMGRPEVRIRESCPAVQRRNSNRRGGEKLGSMRISRVNCVGQATRRYNIMDNKNLCTNEWIQTECTNFRTGKRELETYNR